MRVLYFDCLSGISGDMTVGALCDLGVKPSALEWELSKIELGDYHMHIERQARHAIEGVKFGIHEGATHMPEQDEPGEHGHPHHHEHEHGDEGHSHAHGCCCGHEHGHSHEAPAHEHAHGRSYAEIRALIEGSELSGFVKKHALSIFHRIAVAEGKIHGKAPEEVGFHEVGALDSIADIICTCVGLELLGVDEVRFSPLAEGRGWVECAHGRFPVPAPATLELLTGIPLGQVDEPYEFITPTGAAIAAEFGRSFGVMPMMRVDKIGYGIGSRKLESRPNVLRAILGEADQPARAPYLTDTVLRVQTDLDDLSPELAGNVVNRLMAAGALDASLSPVQMKKGRPGLELNVLCTEELLPRLADVIFAETTAFGLRMDRVERWKLDRRFETVATPFGELTVKLGLRGGEVVQRAPEYESCRAVSERSGQPLRVVYEAALKAAAGLK